MSAPKTWPRGHGEFIVPEHMLPHAPRIVVERHICALEAQMALIRLFQRYCEAAGFNPR